MSSRIDSRTWALLFAWIARRSCLGYKPGILARMSRPDFAGITTAPLRREDGDDVAEMGWCFLSLPEWKQPLLWNYCLMEAEEWKTFSRILGYSEKKLRSIVLRLVLDLQENARSRGIVPPETPDSDAESK